MALNNYYYREPIKLNWGSENLQTPNRFSVGGQSQQFLQQQSQSVQNNPNSWHNQTYPNATGYQGGVQTGGGNPNLGSAIAGGITGAAQIGGDIYAANQEPKSIQTQSPGVQPMDEFGTPAYNLGGQASYLKGLNYKDYGKGLVMKGIGSGAAMGASIGSAIPVVGTAIGAVGGALIGGIAGAFGKRSARRKAKRKIRTARNNFRTAQQNFNEANISATQNRLGREQYNDMLSDPYGINGGYY